MERINWRLGKRTTRRMERAHKGQSYDQRAMLRSSLRQGGIPLDLKYRKRKEKMRPLVLICDISGSMDRYARTLLQFVHTLESGLENVEVFVFSTRLTRITRELRKRDVDQAITDVVNAVDDWSGGTRIGGGLDGADIAARQQRLHQCQSQAAVRAGDQYRWPAGAARFASGAGRHGSFEQ